MTDEEPPGCGIPWLWQRETDPFADACLAHDAVYNARIAGEPTPTLAEVDRAFLERMLAIAGKSWALKARAYFFYGLARAWGLTMRRKLWNPHR